jgi:hypoxanthine-DNA glycosylase
MLTPHHIKHTIPPVYDERSTVLLLGSLPSPKSRAEGFYYGNPQNRLWKILEAVYQTNLNKIYPDEIYLNGTIEAKKKFLRDKHIAMWDVIAECEITGAADSSIKNPVPNDFSKIFKTAKINAVFLTGKKAFTLYELLCASKYNVPYYLLPSPSPANQRIGFEDMVAQYSIINSNSK